MDTSADPEPQENFKQYKLLMFMVRWIGWRPVIGKVMPLFFGKKFLSDPSRKNEVKEWKSTHQVFRQENHGEIRPRDIRPRRRL